MNHFSSPRGLAIIASVLICLAIASCSNAPPTQFYTLSAQALPDEQAIPAPVAVVAVGQVDLPGVLERQQIIRRNGSSQIMVADSQRWGAPLDDMTRAVLTEDLDRLLPPGTVIRADTTPTDARTGIINLDIDRFDSDFGGHVILDVSWNVTKGNPVVSVLRRNEHITVDAPDGSSDAMATAMSRAVAELAQRIAAALQRS